MIVLCLMGFAAASAQATGNWRVEGANIAAEKTIVSEEDVAFKFVSSEENVEFSCTQFSIDSGKLFVSAASLMRMLFKECTAFSITPALKNSQNASLTLTPKQANLELPCLQKGY